MLVLLKADCTPLTCFVSNFLSDWAAGWKSFIALLLLSSVHLTLPVMFGLPHQWPPRSAWEAAPNWMQKTSQQMTRTLAIIFNLKCISSFIFLCFICISCTLFLNCPSHNQCYECVLLTPSVQQAVVSQLWGGINRNFLHLLMIFKREAGVLWKGIMVQTRKLCWIWIYFFVFYRFFFCCFFFTPCIIHPQSSTTQLLHSGQRCSRRSLFL